MSWKSWTRPYADLKIKLESYWRTYGGWNAFIQSPFTHIAIVLVILCFPIWMNSSWPDFMLLILPPILGFTLAGYALVFAFGDDRFRKIMAGSHRRADQPIFYTSISATYLHFIIVQVAAIALAVIAKANPGRAVFNYLAAISEDIGRLRPEARPWVKYSPHLGFSRALLL